MVLFAAGTAAVLILTKMDGRYPVHETQAVPMVITDRHTTMATFQKKENEPSDYALTIVQPYCIGIQQVIAVHCEDYAF
jgi:hypothetical protein